MPCESFTLVSAEKVEASQKPIDPQNTQKSTEWAVCLFKSWLVPRNEHSTIDKCPDNVLLIDDQGLLCKWLCIIASEARKMDDSQYTSEYCSDVCRATTLCQ